MKTKSLLLPLLFILCISGNSQAQFDRVGAKWHYGTIDYIHGTEGYRMYEALYIIPMHGDTFTAISGPQGIYHLMQDSDAVYYKIDSTKYLLFDASYGLNDTLVIDSRFTPVGMPDTIISMSVQITDIQYVKDNSLDQNDSFRVFYFRDLDNICDPMNYDSIGHFTERVIHHIGSYSLRLNEVFEERIVDEGTFYLRCFSSDIYDYQTSSTTHECDFSNTGLNELSALPSSLNIYPNPSTGKFNIESVDNPLSKIVIFDFQGRLIKHIELSKSVYSVEIENLGAGIYQGIITTDLGTFARKIVVK